MSDETKPCRVCSEPTTIKCSSCKLVNYCSRDHQKMDWKDHKDDCRPFVVKSTPELGRYLEAKRRIPSGDVVFKEDPIIFGPRPGDTVCLGCYSQNAQERCPHCNWPICSSFCPGLSDHEHHGAECLFLRLGNRNIEHKYEIILPLRCLILQKRNSKKWKLLTEMESHTRKKGPNTDTYKEYKKVYEYLNETVFKFVDELELKSNSTTIPERSQEMVHKVCGILDTNAHEIALPNRVILHGLYPTAYLLEHNCLPNTRHTFQLDPAQYLKITVFANQDIQSGSHISTMYTHGLWGTQQRQDHLRSTKHFTCRCRRCGDPSELGTNFSALRCLAHDDQRKICGGFQLPIAPLDMATEWRCDRCPTSLTSEQVAELNNMIDMQVEQVKNRNPTIESLSSLLDKLRKLLHKSHYHCYTVKHSLVQLYGRQEGYLPDQMNDLLIQNKIKMCKELLATTYVLDPTASRLALYSSVIELEIADSIMILADRKIWKGNELAEKMKECLDHLARGEKSLLPEEEGSEGDQLKKVIREKIEEVEAYCRLSNLRL